MNDLAKRMRIKAGMIEMGEMIARGSDSALMREAADALEAAAPAVQGEPAGEVPSGYALIPLRNGNPEVTNEMKIKCIGEFSWQEEAPYYDEDGELHDYVATHAVPWSVCKAIYKKMAGVVMLTTAPQSAEQKPIIPNEHGKNRYGLDMSYFRNLFNRELNRPLVDFKPSELARVLARASRTADPKVMHESEFQQPAPDVTHLVEALELALEYWRDRQQRYKNRRPKWVIEAESALTAHRKQEPPK